MNDFFLFDTNLRLAYESERAYQMASISSPFCDGLIKVLYLAPNHLGERNARDKLAKHAGPAPVAGVANISLLLETYEQIVVVEILQALLPCFTVSNAPR